MSKTVKGLMVILDKDYDQEEKEKFITAIKMIQGVLDVESIETEIFNDTIIRNRTIATVTNELNKLLFKIKIGDIKLG